MTFCSSLQAQDKMPVVTVDTLLDQIEAKADTIKTYKAAIRFDQIQGLLGDEQTRFGALYYVTDPKVKFAVDFQRVVIDKKLKEQNRQWVYDGTWLVERVEDKKQFFKRQVHAAAKHDDQSPDDLMSLENSPFPIPLQAKKAQVLKRFNVSIITTKSEKDDPKDIAFYHLKLIPKPDMGINFTQIDLWYDQATMLPVKCHTINDDSDDEQIFSLFKAELNGEIDPKYLSTAVPTERGWQVEITPLEKNWFDAILGECAPDPMLRKAWALGLAPEPRNLNQHHLAHKANFQSETKQPQWYEYRRNFRGDGPAESADLICGLVFSEKIWCVPENKNK